MQRKVVGILLVCVVLLVAIVAGYWDMLQSERLRISNPQQDAAESEVAALPQASPAAEDGDGGTAAGPASGSGAPSPDALPNDATSGEAVGEASQAPRAETGESDAPVPRTSPDPVAAAADPADGRDVQDTSSGETSGSVPSDRTDRVAAPSPDTAPAAPDAATGPDAATSPARRDEPAPDKAARAADSPSQSEGGAGDAGDSTPRFDLLRVEPDGATVIAGRALPGSRIALRDGEATIGTDTANAAGEFAIVLERDLAPGDHAIRITATAEDGAVATSKEIAIVSVPQPGRESELLAMVEAPDEASRLISIPGGEPQDDAAPPPAPETAAAPAGTQAAVPAADQAAADAVAATDVDAVTPPRAASPATAENPATLPVLRVEAVEIEAGKLFVAGAAESGALVRVYIDNVRVAEDRASSEGRFLVSAETPVAPGDHVVRADQLARDGSVRTRVEVPFQRPEGETVAMVAPPRAMSSSEGGAAQDDAAAGSATPSVPRGTGVDGSLGTATRTTPNDTAMTSGTEGASPGVDQPLASGQGTPGEAGVASLSNGEDAVADQPAATSVPPAASVADAGASTEPNPTASPAGLQSDTLPADASGAASAEVPVTRQEALTTAPGRVIIRRGDSLWRISRETYGLGSRYVVIYLANGDQIRNPHLIYPGQVFSVPGERVETPEGDGNG